jgi:hypothetical protein
MGWEDKECLDLQIYLPRNVRGIKINEGVTGKNAG